MKRTVAFAGMLLALGVHSCGVNRAPTEPDLSPPSAAGIVPPGAVIDSAHLLLHVRETRRQRIVLHPVERAWEEATVTWDTLGSGLSPFVITSFVARDTGWIKVDVTPLVNRWHLGTRPNYGLVLDQNAPEYLQTTFHSRESRGRAPMLKVYHRSGGVRAVASLFPVADAWVAEDRPGLNAGRDSLLHSGKMIEAVGEYRALARFDLNAPPPRHRLGDRVWNDLNRNGIQDDGEPGIGGVSVRLLDCGGAVLAETASDYMGRYRFDSLEAGSYRVEFSAPPGFLISPAAQGSDPATDSDAEPGSGRSHCVELSSGADYFDLDAGFYLPPAPVDPGCTRGKGFWKNHAGFGPQEDLVSALLPLTLGAAGGAHTMEVADARTAVQVLRGFEFGHPSNGITKLYASLLMAKLNIAAGADPADVEAFMEECDGLLAGSGYEQWEAMGKPMRDQVRRWTYELDRYNEGEIGPGACPDAAEPAPEGRRETPRLLPRAHGS